MPFRKELKTPLVPAIRRYRQPVINLSLASVNDNLLNKRPKKLLLLIISVSMSKAGKSLKAPGSLKHIEVFPTHVGVNRPWDSGPRPPQCILHAYTR